MEHDSTPEILRKRARSTPTHEVTPTDEFTQADGPEVGAFRQGSPLSQLALGRYLVGRALTESISNALVVVAVVVLALAALANWGLHSTVLAVLLVIVALGVFVLRWILLTVLRKLTGFAQFAPIEKRMNDLVRDTRADVLRELRRVGLPGHVLTLPLLAYRFFGATRRRDTLARIHQFDTDRAVPKARLDEFHLLLRQAFGGSAVSRSDVPRTW